MACIPVKTRGGNGKGGEEWRDTRTPSPDDDRTRKKKKKKISASTTFMMERQHHDYTFIHTHTRLAANTIRSFFLLESRAFSTPWLPDLGCLLCHCYSVEWMQ